MAIRDHTRVDVLVRVADRTQAVDVELVEIKRLLHLDEAGATATCPPTGPPLHVRSSEG